MTNNAGRLYHYRITVSPPTNFLVSTFYVILTRSLILFSVMEIVLLLAYSVVVLFAFLRQIDLLLLSMMTTSISLKGSQCSHMPR